MQPSLSVLPPAWTVNLGVASSRFRSWSDYYFAPKVKQNARTKKNKIGRNKSEQDSFREGELDSALVSPLWLGTQRAATFLFYRLTNDIDQTKIKRILTWKNVRHFRTETFRNLSKSRPWPAPGISPAVRAARPSCLGANGLAIGLADRGA